MDISNLSLDDALEHIKKLRLTPYSELSLPIAQAQLAEYYNFSDRFVYGRHEKIDEGYFLLCIGIGFRSRNRREKQFTSQDFMNVISIIGNSKYKNILKYLHHNYFLSAAAILSYERKIYIPVAMSYRSNPLEPFFGYLLPPDNFNVISPLNVSPFTFYLKTAIKFYTFGSNFYNVLMGMILAKDYDVIIENVEPDSINIPLRDWKDAITVLVNLQLDSKLTRQEYYVSLFHGAKKIEDSKAKLIRQTPLTMHDVYKMINERDERLVYYSYDQLLTFTGMKNVSHLYHFVDYNFYTIYGKIKKYLETDAGFTISTSPSNCKNDHDFYYVPYENYVFIYGPPIEGNCYSTEDLMGSFIVNNPDDYLFRRPDMPGSIFTYETVKKLYEMIEQQAPSIPNFQRDTDPLLRKLAPVFSRPPQEINNIKTLSEDDKELFISMMDHLFQAGMYQRTWKGPGHPYIYKKSETAGSTLEAIECAMTPSFAYIAEDQEKMSENGRKMLKHLPAINKAIPLQPSTYRLWEFLELTTQGKFCIGFGSRIMIETAYLYLSILNAEIENFDYSQFESDSTHR